MSNLHPESLHFCSTALHQGTCLLCCELPTRHQGQGVVPSSLNEHLPLWECYRGVEVGRLGLAGGAVFLLTAVTKRGQALTLGDGIQAPGH